MTRACAMCWTANSAAWALRLRRSRRFTTSYMLARAAHWMSATHKPSQKTTPTLLPAQQQQLATEAWPHSHHQATVAGTTRVLSQGLAEDHDHGRTREVASVCQTLPTNAQIVARQLKAILQRLQHLGSTRMRDPTLDV